MYCGSNPKPPQMAVGNSDQPRPRPMIRSMNISPPQMDAHETKLSRNRTTIFDSPLGVRSDLGSFFAGRAVRRRSGGRPPPDNLAGGGRRISPRAAAPLLVRRDG